ncbi:MAG: sugar ABC transporter permease [Chloroflexi bacterium]|nr:sugar ABC transporter permease [Chloroflexota bacterium]
MAGTLVASTRQVPSASRLWLKAAPYLFISPFYFLFAIFGAFPIGYSLWISFHEWRGLRVGEFVGLRNYALLLVDPAFARAVVNTAAIGLVYVPAMTILSLTFAAILSRELRLRGVYRTGIFLPVVTSGVAVGILFQFFFASPYSPFNAVLGLFGLPAKSWIGEEWFIKPAIVVMLLWRWVGSNMMIMLAGIQTISQELYEAARIDGASGVQSFFFITIPLMARVIAFAMILSTIGMFNLFDEVYLVVGSGGGPYEAGLVTGLLIYRTAFETFKFGYASAIAYAVGVIIIALSMLQIFFSERTAR